MYRILFAITAVFLFSSMVQKQFNIIPISPLKGVTQTVEMPKLTFESYVNGQFQSNLEKHLQQNFGFRPPLIRLYNQYLYDFYKKTFVSENQVVFGKEGWMYEPWFVEEYYQTRMYSYTLDSLDMINRLKAENKRIYQLQHILKEHDVDLFVCLIPGKDLIYPEYLPENTKYFKKKRVNAKDFYGQSMKEWGINHINMCEWFLQMKDTCGFMLFPQKGTHWSNIAAVYAADSIFRYMEDLKGINMNDLIISEKYIGKVVRPDNDLEKLMNLCRPLKKSPHHYVDVDVKTDRFAQKPKLITIGDSFHWNIVEQVPMKKIFSSSPYWYYNSTIYFDKRNKKVSETNIVEELLSSDFIMLSYCTAQQYEMSHGFTKNALLALCYDEEEIKAVKTSLTKHIYSNKKWYESIQDQAKEKNISVDDAIKENVDYLLDVHYEEYFPALKDSIPTKRSSKVKAYLSCDSATK